MEVTYVEGVVSGIDGMKTSVRFLVDGGATYSLLPSESWRAIGLEPKRTAVFTLADGTKLERRVSECFISLSGCEGAEGEAHTPVLLGEPNDEALLGGVTLEILGLVLNPFTRKLQPMRMLLA